jgi:tetratricopeptide (TPR) repeat protein
LPPDPSFLYESGDDIMKRAMLSFLFTFALGMGYALSTRTQLPGESTPPSAIRIEERPLKQIDQTIAFYEQRVKEDPIGAIALSQLAQWYLHRSRRTGEIDDAMRAEQAARRSLAIRTRNNASAFHHLAQSLLAQHRLREAVTAINRARACGFVDEQTNRLAAEASLEIGDYAQAAKELHGLVDDHHPATLALRARMLELNGSPELALDLLRRGLEEGERSHCLTPDDVSWFHVRMGHILAMTGDTDRAKHAYNTALEQSPHNYHAMGGLVHLAIDRHDWKAAIKWGEPAIEIAPMPEVLAMIGDAHAALGDSKKAESYYRRVEALCEAATSRGIRGFDRHLALYYADHDRQVSKALFLARRDLKERKDVYAYDTLAWALYKAGKPHEADSAMTRALALGTRDVHLFQHAAIIAYACGDKQRGNEYLTLARS